MTNNRIPGWLNRMDTLSEHVSDRFGNLTGEQLDLKPDAGTWSIAENLSHIIKVNESYFPLIESLRNGKLQLPWHARLGFVNRLFGSMLLKAVKPETKRKLKTFPIWEPVHTNNGKEIVARFLEHQQKLKDFIRSCEDLIKNGTVIHSPANRNITYTLEAAFDIITEHGSRHYHQALDVLKASEEQQGTATRL